MALLLSAVPNPGQGLTPDSVEREGKIDHLISWLLEEGRDLSNIPFAEVVAATAGVKILPFDPDSADDQRILGKIAGAVEAVLADINQPGHPIHEVGRINEVSGPIEDLLLEELDAIEGFICTYPPTAQGRVQRSGYPDLRLLDEPSGRVFYLDPKVHADGSDRSTFRTFYFEPKVETNKIQDDATHLIVGIAHGGRVDGNWTFLDWNLVDLHDFEVRLKAEFQASNRDLYRPEAIIARSDGPDEDETAQADSTEK